MGICILGMGDCGSKSDNRSITNIKNVNQTMTNMVSNTSVSTNVQQANIQRNKIKVLAPPGYDKSWGPLMKNCTVKSSQNMNASQTVKVSLDLKDETALKNQISTALKTANETAQKNKTEFLATASTTSNNYTEVNQVIENLVSTNISKSVYDDLKQLMESIQENEGEFYGPIECAPGTAFYENAQTMVVKQVADKLTKALTGTSVDNVLETKVENTNKTVQEGESGGATGLLNAFGGIFTGPLMMILGIVIAVAVLGIIGLVIFKSLGSKKAAAFGGMLFGRKKSRFGSKRW
jgi:hypothetical protein